MWTEIWRLGNGNCTTSVWTGMRNLCPCGHRHGTCVRVNKDGHIVSVWTGARSLCLCGQRLGTCVRVDKVVYSCTRTRQLFPCGLLLGSWVRVVQARVIVSAGTGVNRCVRVDQCVALCGRGNECSGNSVCGPVSPKVYLRGPSEGLVRDAP